MYTELGREKVKQSIQTNEFRLWEQLGRKQQ